MAVAHTSHFPAGSPGSGMNNGGVASTSIAFTSVTISGTNPCLVLMIAVDDTHGSTTVSSVVLSAGLTGGTPVQVGTVIKGNNTLYLWSIPAPTGTGTVTATLSNSIVWQASMILFANTDQTTPLASGDVASATGATNPLSATALNLTANDAAVGLGSNIAPGDAPTFQQSQTYNDNGTAVNTAMGYQLGTGALSVNWGTPDANDALLVARVIASSGGVAPTLWAASLL